MDAPRSRTRGFSPQTFESWYSYIPGLKVAMPATPYDAKGMLISAIRDPDPVMFIEHSLLYSTRGAVPEELRRHILLWVGCIAGALEETQYRAKLAAAGFEGIGIEPTRVYRVEDPRARVLRGIARDLGAPRFEVAEAIERAALAALAERKPHRVLATNIEFWAKKLGENPPRDARNEAALRESGWHVVVVWECETKDEHALRTRLLGELLSARAVPAQPRSAS